MADGKGGDEMNEGERLAERLAAGKAEFGVAYVENPVGDVDLLEVSVIDSPKAEEAYVVPAAETDDAQITAAPELRWKFRVRCCICGELIEEFAETPKGRVPTGHLHPDGLQCEGCYRKAEAHKAE